MCSRVLGYCLRSPDGTLLGDRSSPCESESRVQMTGVCSYFMKEGLNHRGHNPRVRAGAAEASCVLARASELKHFVGFSPTLSCDRGVNNLVALGFPSPGSRPRSPLLGKHLLI